MQMRIQNMSWEKSIQEAASYPLQASVRREAKRFLGLIDPLRWRGLRESRLISNAQSIALLNEISHWREKSLVRHVIRRWTRKESGGGEEATPLGKPVLPAMAKEEPARTNQRPAYEPALGRKQLKKRDRSHRTSGANTSPTCPAPPQTGSQIPCWASGGPDRRTSWPTGRRPPRPRNGTTTTCPSPIPEYPTGLE